MLIPGEDFYRRDGLIVAPELVGKLLIRKNGDEETVLRITETECYLGTQDTACHASKGRTARTEMLYKKGGTIYVYICYGIHYLMNIITGEEEVPQGVLIRACEGYEGPGRLTKKLQVDKSFNGENILRNPRICLADDGYVPKIIRLPRVGIDYAEKKDREALWRFADKGKMH
ncbi:MAG: DNA-3-methyladenine glycosylase [Oscillospiraceae bacterium]|nr:DNA-3-methyladenine glycosylase [Oscillospiraceae bacterium]